MKHAMARIYWFQSDRGKAIPSEELEQQIRGAVGIQNQDDTRKHDTVELMDSMTGYRRIIIRTTLERHFRIERLFRECGYL